MAVLLVVFSWAESSRAEEGTSARVLLLQAPGSCSVELLLNALSGFDVSFETMDSDTSSESWTEAAKQRAADGGYEVVVGVFGGDEGTEVRVVSGESAFVKVLQADGAGCDGAAAMAVLYANRLMRGSTFPEGPVPALHLPTEKPVETKLPENVASNPVGSRWLRLSLDVLGVFEANFRDESPMLLGGELRLVSRIHDKIHWDIGFAGASFVGLTGDYEGLQGAGLIFTSRLGYALNWPRLQMLFIAALGFADYPMRRSGATDWEQSVLPRGELGLQLRAPTVAGLFAELTVLWEPWTIDVISEELGQAWSVGGICIGLRLGVSFGLLNGFSPSQPLTERKVEGSGP